MQYCIDDRKKKKKKRFKHNVTPCTIIVHNITALLKIILIQDISIEIYSPRGRCNVSHNSIIIHRGPYNDRIVTIFRV